ncbi:PREDICTED: protocadherin gamma-A10 [Chrysochloris asiatica]|uniref:Protocadherin gamma-A10 n=1 Tax=Chrysochloris asiatica TaxID=185453 RepID=A0A9B0TTB8_CHRAS|nr:PREDICTED: protocadherin gamma-A10 [Chrysochloris asiatica]
MAAQRNRPGRSELVLLCLFVGMLWESGARQIRYSVPEELDKGSFVGNISKDLGLEPRELAERGVRIVSRGRTLLFALDPRSGSLITAGRIDREEICAQIARCLVNFNILVEDRVKLFGIEIEVTDINDNAPKFQAENLDIKINENVPPGTHFPLPEAVDPDVGVNSLQSYQLSPNKHFSLQVHSRANGIKYPELVLERALDREEEAVHHLVLTASDRGDPLRSGTALVSVTVFDANDNAPVFTLPEYLVSVPENLPVGSRLLTVTATDRDEGANGEVTYSFRKLPDTHLLKFQLNKNTGEIKISENLDYEETNFFEIEIQAEDGGAYLATAKVLITVEDVNDNSPEVTITSLFSPVAEDAPLGTVIALLHVHDLDSGQNGQVTCSISGNLPFKLEKSIDSYYRLVTNRALDREQVSRYNITVTATDGGSPVLSTETQLTLLVADINDNPPTFSYVSYSTYIPENNPRGASIFSVTAHDPDSEKNSQVTYSLIEDTIQGAPLSSYVSINSDTGILYALQSFDYEQFRELQMQVMACDSGDPPLSSNISLSLFVLDQNDNAPEILYPTLPTDGSTGVELAPRSAEPGYLVTKVVAVDRDSGQNAWLSYRLLKASEPGLFAVGVHTGEVRTVRALQDRDTLKQSLLVAVQDHGQPPLSATVTLTVAVADSIPDILADLGNLEPPADPNASDITLYLVVAVATVSCVFLAFVIVLMALRLRRWHMKRLLQTPETALPHLQASQFMGMDGVQAFLQTYSHEVSLTADSGKSHIIFPQPNYADTLISQESCEKKDPLSLLDDSRFPIEDTPLVPVICRERRICELQLEAVVENPLNIFHVLVVVEDINDHAPQFRKDEINLEISESVTPGMRTILESAKDPDIDTNSLSKYQLSPNEYFSLVVKDNPDGGKYPELLLQKTLDREKQSSHHLVLTAFDSGDPPRSGTTQIRVQVVDANDNPPVFSQDVYRVSLREDVPRGTTVLRVRATDLDEGVNSEITYSFLGVADKAQHVFSLDSTTGDITTNQSLDFEEVERYTMGVEAKDPGSLSTQCKIIIDVLDKNDNSPEIIITSLSDQILENSHPGMVVALFKTRDRDSGENGEVLCHIGRDVPFRIHSSSKNYYKIVTDGALDREQTPEYNITIVASDRGKPPLSSSTSLILQVADVNDNAPVFRQSPYVVSVPENNPPGASIAQVEASDPDLGPNCQVSYSIVASDLEPRMLSSYVSVNAQSGVVFAQRAFDHEQLRAFELTLQARDQGSPALSANVSLRVLVGDRNDNAPRVLYPALGPDGSALFDMVPRAAQPGYLVTKVVAVDADSGHNAWLSYHVLQVSEPGLFSLGFRTGEVRTARALSDRDGSRQRLLVAVRDGGKPPLSATATLLLVFADSLQEALPDLNDQPTVSDPQADLQFYLVVSLAVISVLFLLAVILAISLRLRRSSSPAAGGCFGSVLCVKSDLGVPPNYSEGTLPYAYNMCVPGDQANPEFHFLTSVDHCPVTQDSVSKNGSSMLLASILTPSVEADKTFQQVSF